jgi:hypothetical protein
VFDLESGVYLQKVEEAIITVQELHRAEIVVSGLFGESACSEAQLLTYPSFEIESWCLFDDFLIAALERAIAGSERNNSAMEVSGYLNLYVTRRRDKTLDKYLGTSKRLERLTCSALQRFCGLIDLGNYSHTSTATTSSSFDDNWKPYLRGEVAKALHMLVQ